MRTRARIVRPGAVSGAGKLAKLPKRQRLLSAPWLASQWTLSALGGTIAGAADTADGSYAGGDIITMTQSTTAGPKNIMETTARLYVPAIGNTDPWFATFELQVASGQFVTVNATNNASTALWSVQVGLPDHRLVLKCPGGSDITVNPTAFDQAQWHRVSVVVTPATATTGTIRYYLHWTSTASSTEVHQYLGSHDYSTNAIVSRVIVTQSWVATGVVNFARLVVGEVFGITNGCSVDAGYVGWCASPKTGREFAANNYNYRRNPAWLLTQQLFGDADWFLNHARGGHTVAEMAAEFQDFVLSLTPKLVSIGSATNSINNAVVLGTDVAAVAALATDKASYLLMCQQALATGAAVVATGVAPRHDTVPSLDLARWVSYAKDWNAWMLATLVPLGVGFADVWTLLEDPADPGKLVSWANAGDAVHFTWRAQKEVADKQFRALLPS